MVQRSVAAAASFGLAVTDLDPLECQRPVVEDAAALNRATGITSAAVRPVHDALGNRQVGDPNLRALRDDEHPAAALAGDREHPDARADDVQSAADGKIAPG